MAAARRRYGALDRILRKRLLADAWPRLRGGQLTVAATRLGTS